jgi:hypothetical protein
MWQSVLLGSVVQHRHLWQSVESLAHYSIVFPSVSLNLILAPRPIQLRAAGGFWRFSWIPSTGEGTTFMIWHTTCARRGALLIITWILTLSPNFHHHFQSSHLGLVHNDPSDFATFGSTHWSLLALARLVSVAILLGPLQWRRNFALSTGVSF